MGGGESKIEAEQKINSHLLEAQKQQKAANDANLKRIEDSQRAAEESRRKDAELHRKEVAEKEAAATRKEEAFMNELRVLKSQQEQSRMMSDKLNKEERQKMQEARDKAVQAKEEELSRHRADAALVLASLHANNDKKEREHLAELKTINEDRIRQTERHGQKMRKLTEQKNRIINEMQERMLTNQKEAYEWLLAQERTHLQSVTEMYTIIARVPGAIISDREAHAINERVAALRDSITSASDSFHNLQELLLENVSDPTAKTVNLAGRPAKAAAMASLCTSLNAKFTEIRNMSDKSQNLRLEVRQALNESIETVRTLVRSLNSETMKIRVKINRAPESITLDDLTVLGDTMTQVTDAIHNVASVEGARAVQSLEDDVVKFKQVHDADYARLPGPPTPKAPPALEESTIVHDSTDAHDLTDPQEPMDTHNSTIPQDSMNIAQ